MVTPPVFIKAVRSLRHAGQKPEWEYIPEGWAYADSHPEVRGWNVADILQVYTQKWPQFVSFCQGTRALGISHESDLRTNFDVNYHNSIMTFGYALAMAAHGLDRLTMLDWGGGIGHYYLLAKALLPEVEIEYHCKDMPILAEYGKKLFPEQHFYSDNTCLQRHYDFVFASSALHYSENWQDVLSFLAGAARGYLCITRLPTVFKVPSFVCIQRPYSYGYNTEYLGWCLNHTSFLTETQRRTLKLTREFLIGETPAIHGAPEQCQNMGFLFASQQ